jgi:hypothetical protein
MRIKYLDCPRCPDCTLRVVGFLEGPTMVSRTSDWRDELGRWLKPFLDRLGHKARRQMCPLYDDRSLPEPAPASSAPIWGRPGDPECERCGLDALEQVVQSLDRHRNAPFRSYGLE